MSEWISAHDTKKRAIAEGYSEECLIEWAKQGRLSARATHGVFSDDEPGEVRSFPAEPPTEKMELDRLGSWPNIPSDFWWRVGRDRGVAIWGPGTFGATVYFDEQIGQNGGTQHIELLNVMFNETELTVLLLKKSEQAVDGTPRKLPLSRRKPLPQQRLAFEFLEKKAPQHLPNGSDPMIAADLYRCYCDWMRSGGRSDKVMVINAFNKSKERYLDGHRIVRGAFVDVSDSS